MSAHTKPMQINFIKICLCSGRNYDVEIMNLFQNFIFATQKCL